jgi:hypothetical protein
MHRGTVRRLLYTSYLWFARSAGIARFPPSQLRFGRGNGEAPAGGLELPCPIWTCLEAV